MSTTTTTTIDKFLWVCELSKDNPSKKWNPNDYSEMEDKEAAGIVINTLVLNSALLGSKAIEGERNMVCLKTKGARNMDIDYHPIICLTLGRNELANNFDLTLSNKDEIEFKLTEGQGPVYITCSHVSEVQYTDDLETIMTGSETDKPEQEIDDVDEELKEEEDADEDEEEQEVDAKAGAENEEKKTNGTEETNGKTNGKAKSAFTNGKHVIKTSKTDLKANGHGEAAVDAEIEEKPGKRKRQQ